MDSAPSIETVLQAIHALYHHPDPAGKEKASVWLGELQKSVFAWQIADHLLQQNRDLESCYIAAQTMRTKIQYAFHELPPATHQSLRNSLLDHISKTNAGTNQVIVTQLCLALADLALQMATWKNAARDLIDRFSGNVDHVHCLVEILTVMPEEVNSRSLRLGANRRSEIIDELTETAPMVLQLLAVCRENFSQEEKMQTKIFRCLASWFNVAAVPQDLIVQSPMLTAPFQALVLLGCSSTLHEAATDCVCAALYCTEDSKEMKVLSEALFQAVMTLTDAYHMSVAQEDLDKSINFCRIFTEMAESFLEAMLKTPNQGLGDFRTLEILCTCVGHHQYEIAEITFNFWYRLSEMLYQRNDEIMNRMFSPYIQRLIIALCRHCQLDPDHDSLPDENDDFGDFRARVSELIKDVVFLVGSANCFAQMFDSLKNQSSETSWDVSEAALFVMCAVAKFILPDENEIVPQVLQAILHLPESAHIAVKYTSVQLIGELSEWIEQHPDVLEPVLQFLMVCLHVPSLASVSASALLYICEQCKQRMTDHFAGLMQIIQAIDSFNLDNDAAVGLLKGVSLILAKLPHEKITEGLKEMCILQITPLQKILDDSAKDTGSKADPTVWLDRLAAIFRHTNPTVINGQLHPCQPVVQEVWPVLSRACHHYQADVKIVERCCRCIRFAIRCVGKGSAALLTPLVTQMVEMYSLHQHSCFLYLGSILVDEYGEEEGCQQGLLDMVKAFMGPAFKQLEEPNGFRNHPDTVDDWFRLCLRFIQRAPQVILQSPVAKPVLMCGVAACPLDHKEANASVMKFLTELIRAGREKEKSSEDAGLEVCRSTVQGLIKDTGEALVQSLLSAAVFFLPSYMIVDAAEVLYELMQLDRPAVCKWLEHALKSLPTESSGGAVTATQKQLVDFHKEVTSAEGFKQVSHALRDFSRLYR
ncbi:transportin-3 [Lingula anatina]|uniref:Transportin-3 n=1 Tax=Lingula anatina TaxID=7574 RepID=A0A1S3K2Y4_LINAN|nr:transportin-3 [Lingula anatina]|eukprot:XP_013416764.1 transportin-3 [Lingula anatina]